VVGEQQVLWIEAFEFCRDIKHIFGLKITTDFSNQFDSLSYSVFYLISSE
jgi:hypothetical protein